MTRHGYYCEGYEAEWDPDTDDTDSFMGYTDSESELGEEVLPEPSTRAITWRWKERI